MRAGLGGSSWCEVVDCYAGSYIGVVFTAGLHKLKYICSGYSWAVGSTQLYRVLAMVLQKMG